MQTRTQTHTEMPTERAREIDLEKTQTRNLAIVIKVLGKMHLALIQAYIRFVCVWNESQILFNLFFLSCREFI